MSGARKISRLGRLTVIHGCIAVLILSAGLWKQWRSAPPSESPARAQEETGGAIRRLLSRISERGLNDTTVSTNGGFWRRWWQRVVRRTALPATLPDPLQTNPVFHSLLTLEYTDGRGGCRIQQEGTVQVRRERQGEDRVVRYGFGYLADVAYGGETMGEVQLPGTVLFRDPVRDRLVGGDEGLRSLGLLANAALTQLKARFIPDGTEQVFTFRAAQSTPLMPEELTFRLRGVRKTTAQLGEAILATAHSEPFSLQDPVSGRRMEARYASFYVMDSAMEIVFYQCSRFEARLEAERLAVENLLVLVENGAPVRMIELEDDVISGMRAIGLSEMRESALQKPTTELPLWTVSALVGMNSANVLAGAAIEGRPNFAITATIGLVLLVDAAISAGTTLLHEAGVIDWEWRGIPNAMGSATGRGIAWGYTLATGESVNPDFFAETGGLVADVLSLFLPERALSAGVTATTSVGSKAIRVSRITRGLPLSGKALRVSFHGIQIVRSKRGIFNSARAFRKMEKVRTALDGALVGVEARNYVLDWDVLGTRRLPPPLIGDISFRIYWIPPKDDVDLHVLDPNGHRIWYRAMECPCGGQLDRDDTTSGGPENIFWPVGQAPKGRYKCWTHYYRGTGERRVVVEIREGERVVKAAQFILGQEGDKSPAIEWNFD